MELTELTVDSKKLWFVDNVFPKDQLGKLNQFCYNRPYYIGQTSSLVGEDSRRSVSHLSLPEISSIGSLWYINQAVKRAGLNLICQAGYVNTYQIMTPTAKHCDFDRANYYTIIVFANAYWHDDWGGELTFYGRDKINYTVEFEPGRVVITDARIEHRVNPLTPASKDFRFTLALKCADTSEITNRNLQSSNYFSLDDVRLM
jgi:hypothetical protein